MVGDSGVEKALTKLTERMSADGIFRKVRLTARHEKGDVKRTRLEYESCKRIHDAGMKRKVQLLSRRHNPLTDMPI